LRYSQTFGGPVGLTNTATSRAALRLRRTARAARLGQDPRLMCDRRQIVAGLGATAMLSSSPARAAIARPESLHAAAAEVYLYTLPLIESAAARAAVVAGDSPVDTLFRLRQPRRGATMPMWTRNPMVECSREQRAGVGQAVHRSTIMPRIRADV
jgi:hypothetical protein